MASDMPICACDQMYDGKHHPDCPVVAIIAVLRAEVVAWREWHDYDGESVETNHFNYQDRIDARAATDAAGALGKDGE